MPRIGFVGLGVMGAPMASHLHRHGYDPLVWNRTAAKAEPLRAAGVRVAPDLESVGRECDLVFLCVTRSEDVADCLGRLMPVSRPGTLFVDHSTILPAVARDLHALAERMRMRFLDAPITGGSMGAQNGTLTIFVGGNPVDFAEAEPAMKAYARRAECVGGPGMGQAMKMVNQVAVAGALLGLCEAVALAEKARLDLAQTLDMVGSGAAGSWAFTNYGPRILAEDWTPGFSIVNQRKDFRYCREFAAEVDAALPGTEIVDQLLADLEDEGHGEWTTVALYDRMRRLRHQP